MEQPYTVVIHWQDNGQSEVRHVTAPVFDVAKVATFDEDRPYTVLVFDGHHTPIYKD